MKTITKSIGLSAVLLALLLSGCASTPQVKERFFWPALPEVPRIEWLGTYSSQLDMKVEKSSFAMIVGEEDPVSINNPAGIAADGEGRVFVGDLGKSSVMVFNFNTKEVHLLGGSASTGLFKNPSGIAFDAEGNIYAGDLDNNKIYLFDKNENPLRTINLEGIGKSVGFFAIDKGRKRIIIPDVRGHKVHILDLDGKLIKSIYEYRKGNEKKNDGFNFPASVALDPKGNIIVADSMNSRIIRFTPEGEYLSTIGQRGDAIGDIAMIKGVAADSEGHIYMTDVKSNRMQIFNEKGEILLYIGKQSANPQVVGGFYGPTGIYIDQNDAIYVTEKLARRFQIYQYLDSRYLALHPITPDTAVAKPMVEDVKKIKGDEKKPPVAPLK